MRPAECVAVVSAVLPIALVACSSSANTAPTTTTSTTANGSTIATAPTTATVPRTATTATGTSPNALEINPAGDIPDNQVFVTFSSTVGGFSVDVPEGWARTEANGATAFADHFNSIRLEAKRSPVVPTVANVRSTEVPALQQTEPGFHLGDVTSVSRKSGSAVLVTYRAVSAADAVTGKHVVLDVERYEFSRNGSRVAITLSAPRGSDNVDPWRRVTDSFAWSA